MPEFVLLLLVLAQQTPSDQDLAALAREARSKKFDVRLAAYDRLIELGEPARPLLVKLLREAEEKAAKDFLDLAKGRAARGFRKWLGKEIARAREEALSIIRDRELYPDDAHGEKGQHLVDNKVARLRELWRRPSRLFAEKVPEINDRLYYIKEATDNLRRAGLSPEIYLDHDEAMRDLDRLLDPPGLMLSKKERREVEELFEYNDTTPSVATDEERRFVRILNDYRLMLGLPVLELDDRLVTASRKHSQEMMNLDYFAHESPVEENRTPGMRAGKEGFSGSVLENCAVARSAQGAFDGWYRSSGHHRGMISASARQIGAGHSIRPDGSPGSHWTMLAGSADSLRGKKPRQEPRLLFLSRRQQLADDDVATRHALARFCRKHELLDEARELLLEIVTIDPEDKRARELLGHVRSNGRWVTAEEKLKEDLAHRSAGEAAAAVRDMMQSDEPHQRVAAVRAAGQLGTDGVAIAVKALKDDASEVRVAACETLAALSDASAVPALKGALSDRSFYVAHSAAAALARLGDRSGIPVLFEGLRSGNLNHRIDAHRKARAVFGRDFGYAWDLPAVERARVVDEWEAWAREQEKGG